ncbi:MAG: substrate-binding domain-containing protein [Oscillospiraceae bacterium]|nr:substrate-binding domain-containing protein [Oscillospiraceae bacterium]
MIVDRTTQNKVIRNTMCGLCILFYILICLSGCVDRNIPGPDDLSPDEGDPPVLALVVKDISNPYMQRMYDGFQMACEEVGSRAILRGPVTPNITGQIEAIDDLIRQEVSAIAVAANDADALEETLNRAMKNGIRVISLDSAVNAKSRTLHIQPADPEVIGRVLVQAAARMSRGSGQIAILSATPQATNQNLWIEWMLRELKDYPDTYKNIELTEIVYGDDVAGKSAEQARYLLDTYSELDVIIAPTVVGMLAAGTVIEERSSKVLLTGLALPSEMERFIKSEICPWMYLWNPIEVGYLGAYASKALCDGVIDGREGQTFVAGQLGTKIITEAFDGGMEVVLANPVKFDIDNISDWKSIY